MTDQLDWSTGATVGRNRYHAAMAEQRTWFLFDDAATLSAWLAAQAVVDHRLLERPWTAVRLVAADDREPMLALAPGEGHGVVTIPPRLSRRVATVQGYVEDSGTHFRVVSGPENRTGTPYPLVGPAKTWSNAVQAVPVRKWRTEPDQVEVVFLAPDKATFERLVHEHLAVGVPDLRVAVVAAPDGTKEWVIRAAKPAWFVVGRAVGRPGTSVYWRVPGSNVWIEWGYEHPLVRHLKDPGDDAMLLADRRGWRLLEVGGWRDVTEVIDFDVEERRLVPTGRRPELRVRLRLEGRTERGAANLWILPESEGVDVLEGILNAVGPDGASAFTFAWLAHEGDGRRFLAFREAIAGRSANDMVRRRLAHWPGYVAIPGLVGLHVPADKAIGPPLRPDRLTSVLGLMRSDVTVVDEPEDKSVGLAVTKIPDVAFRPLDRFVDVLATMDAEPVRTTTEPADLGRSPFELQAPPADPDEPREPRTRRRS